MQYISSDTNVWIDFSVIGRSQYPFRLQYTYIMHKDAVTDELLSPPGLGEELVSYGLQPVERMIKKTIYIMSKLPAGSHIGQIDNAPLTIDFFPRRFATHYDYDFLYKLLDRLGKLTSNTHCVDMHNSKTKEINKYKAKCAADELLYYWADMEIDEILREDTDEFFFVYSGLDDFITKKWDKLSKKEKKEAYENDRKNYEHEFFSHFPCNGSLTWCLCRGLWGIHCFQADCFEDDVTSPYYIDNWFDEKVYRDYYRKIDQKGKRNKDAGAESTEDAVPENE